MLREISQRNEDICQMISLICGLLDRQRKIALSHDKILVLDYKTDFQAMLERSTGGMKIKLKVM